MGRSRRKGVTCKGSCDIKETPLLVRGDVVSCELSNGQTVEFPDTWGLVHDPIGECIDRCEILVCPYSIRTPPGVQLPDDVLQIATDYWGDGYPLQLGFVELPEGPWDRVGRIARVYYDRYGELASKYQHPFKEVEKDSAVLFRQRKAQRYGRSSHKAYRISLADGCVINAHGFVWP